MSRQFTYKLPSGVEVTFREPTLGDRQDVISKFNSSDKNGIGTEELLASYCVVAINGMPPRDPDYRVRLRGWLSKDVQIYVNLFYEMFGLNDDDVKVIKEAAKKLLQPDSEPMSESPSEQS